VQRPVILAVAAALACVAAGCRDEAPKSATPLDTSTLTAAELGWTRAYSAWTFGFYDDEPDLGQDAVADCRDEIAKIGPAPSERLEEAASQLPAICPLLEQIGSLRRAQDGVERVDDLVRPYFRDEQSLQLRSGVTDRSRADVVLSGIASDVVGHPVEVRCWDEKDWSRVLGEDDAWNDDDSSDDLVGWSEDSDDRIHLLLELCNRITVVKVSDLTRWRRFERIDAIDAIETLRHEIEHFLSPDASEAETECGAIRALPRFAQRFGVTAADARDLTELYREVVYPTLDTEYTDGGCPRKG
jgi:hypothetical protein